MDIRKTIREEVKRVILNEFKIPFSSPGTFKDVPSTFDHLKWDFSPNQKFYLQELCEVDPDSLKESDYKSASKILDIPEGNVKSIINTHSIYSPLKEGGRGDSTAAVNSRLTFGNKAANAFDIGLDNNAKTKPIKSNTQMMNNPPTMSKPRMEYEGYKNVKDRKLYRTEKGEEHPSKSRERFYENLNTSLMMFLFCEANPKDINLREDDKIQLDFDAVIEENKFNHLAGGPSYENEKHRKINELLSKFNEKFGSSYVIYDHVETEKGIRIFVEHNVTSQIDMSEDSMSMMKKFLLTKVITGHKIEQENAQIASLMGLDAGDTTWLYGPIGQAPQSGILTKNK